MMRRFKMLVYEKNSERGHSNRVFGETHGVGSVDEKRLRAFGLAPDASAEEILGSKAGLEMLMGMVRAINEERGGRIPAPDDEGSKEMKRGSELRPGDRVFGLDVDPESHPKEVEEFWAGRRPSDFVVEYEVVEVKPRGDEPPERLLREVVPCHDYCGSSGKAQEEDLRGYLPLVFQRLVRIGADEMYAITAQQAILSLARERLLSACALLADARVLIEHAAHPDVTAMWNTMSRVLMSLSARLEQIEQMPDCEVPSSYLRVRPEWVVGG